MRSAVILAGGSSIRLGAEKSLLVYDRRPLLCQTIEKLLQVTDEVIVVARDEDHARCLKELVFGAVFTWDSISGFGPVAGLDAGMRCAKGRLAFATGCDLPFLNLEVIERLFDFASAREGYEAAVPVRPNGFLEPLHSVYDREKMLSACQRALQEGERRTFIPLQELRIRRIPMHSLRQLDPDLLTFFNINTPEDLKEARVILALGQASGQR
ncbi:Molybdenum cofactor guanylyltransferase [uncultured archaeon]|nr:Molybdenum cofactor guanylyltransferase [uncultured archaeon]